VFVLRGKLSLLENNIVDCPDITNDAPEFAVHQRQTVMIIVMPHDIKWHNVGEYVKYT